MLVAGCALAAPAAGSAADSARTVTVGAPERADSASSRGVPADSPVTRGDAAAPRPPWHEQPRFVMLRTLVLPGWGQWHNRSYFKAVGVAAGSGALGVAVLGDRRELERLQREANAAAAAGDQARYAAAVSGYNARLDQYVGRQWLFGAVLVYALIDAYVDAHFRNFDVEFRTDPALPQGLPDEPAAPRKGSRSGGSAARAAIRWRF